MRTAAAGVFSHATGSSVEEPGTVAEAPSDTDKTLVERWLQDQQQWQRTLFAYLDSMVKNDDFLVHLGNAMRGSLLAGKPYPTAPPPGVREAETAPPDDRLDRALFALHQLQGQFQDVLMALEEIRTSLNRPASVSAPASKAAAPAARSVARSAATRRSPAAAARRATTPAAAARPQTGKRRKPR